MSIVYLQQTMKHKSLLTMKQEEKAFKKSPFHSKCCHLHLVHFSKQS